MFKKTENYSHPLKQSWLMVPDCKRFSHLQFVALPVLTSRVGGGKLVVATRQTNASESLAVAGNPVNSAKHTGSKPPIISTLFSPFEVILNSGILSSRPKIK